MSVEQAMAFAMFAFVAAVTPGPSNVLVTTAGANLGIVRGLPCLLGVIVGMGVMMFTIPLGLGALLLGHPVALLALKACGAAFLLWLAYRIATSPPAGGGEESLSGDGGTGFVAAAVFQWMNPKSWLVSISAAGTYLEAGAGNALLQAAMLGGLFMLAAAPACFAWLAFGAAMRHWLRRPRVLRTFNVTMGVLLALSVLLIVT